MGNKPPSDTRAAISPLWRREPFLTSGAWPKRRSGAAGRTGRSWRESVPEGAPGKGSGLGVLLLLLF